MEAADSYFHVELTAVVDGLLKAAVVEICALADRWRDDLRMEITTSRSENEQLKRKLQIMEQSLSASRVAQSKNVGHQDKKTQFPEVGTNPTDDCGNVETELTVPKGNPWVQQCSFLPGVIKVEAMDISVTAKAGERLYGKCSNVLHPPHYTNTSNQLLEFKTERKSNTEPEVQMPEAVSREDISTECEVETQDSAATDGECESVNQKTQNVHFTRTKTKKEDDTKGVELTAVLDVLMKTAVSDICALAESWFQSLHMEIARSKKENEDLRQKLQRMQEQNPQAAAETELESQSTKEEKDEDTGSEVRDTDDSGCTVFAGTSTEDLAASAQLWLSSSEEEQRKKTTFCHICVKEVGCLKSHLEWHDQKFKCHICHKMFHNKVVFSRHLNMHTGTKHACDVCRKTFGNSKKRNFSATESAPAERAHSRWNHTPVGTKAEMMDRSIGERVEPKLDDTEINSQCYVLSSELKTEPEKFQPALQTSECSIDVGSDSENESEECVMLDENRIPHICLEKISQPSQTQTAQ
ncbi:hypothetical protein PHYPO_G00001780 [Pangasianodon hypophthalmus]|uniref:C2H2-type domain-containing protein n=1 Tax=Pangasianodon hypophthalmus TaxID=310915 RepID=A0A5N5Q3G8_PANHP|nr:hypothetical protein PHYPO_G00001780 [Pangasianodon hypophthalmus]